MTPGQLVQAVSIAVDVPEETVVQHDRNLAIAGLRTMGGRGRSAPAVSVLDAARLLVAILASMRTKDSVATVRAFEQTAYAPPISHEQTMAELVNHIAVQAGRAPKSLHSFSPNALDPAIDSLPKEHNFIEGIAALITEASGATIDIAEHFARFGRIQIECRAKPTLCGTIYCKPETGSYALKKDAATDYLRANRRHGISQLRSILGISIILLGQAFREDGLNSESASDTLREFWSSRNSLGEGLRKTKFAGKSR